MKTNITLPIAYKKVAAIMLALFISVSIFAQALSGPATFTAILGTPANGANHYIDMGWAAVSGATSYEVQYSVNGTTWDSLYKGTNPYYSHNTGSMGNMPFYYKVRSIQVEGISGWTNCATYPMYNACNNPLLPQLTNATNASVSITIPQETPYANSPATTYSIFCTTDSLYVQPNGSMGAQEVYLTRAAWRTVTVSNLNPGTNYCFLSRAKNGGGDTRMAGVNSIAIYEPWVQNILDTTSASPTNNWWSPDTSASGPMKFISDGCQGGSVGFEGSNNHNWHSFLRSPAFDCTNLGEVTYNFTLTNSYFPSHTNDRVTVRLWAPTITHPNGEFVDAITINGKHGSIIPFDSARSCEAMTAIYSLANVTDKSAITFYLFAESGYNDNNLFSVQFDNTSLGAGGESGACMATTGAFATGVEETSAATFDVYPNPFTDHITVKFADVPKNAFAMLYDELGNEVSRMEVPQDIEHMDIPSAGLVNGIYFLSIVSEGHSRITKKVMKMN